MAFGNDNFLTRDNSEANRLKEERKRAMFDSSSETVTQGLTEYPKNVLINMPLNLIDVNPDNEYIYNDQKHANSQRVYKRNEILKETIKEDGFRGIIEVFKKPDGRFEISSGHRRFFAVKNLNHTTIPTIIRDTPNSIKRAELLLRANITNREYTPLIRAREIDYYIKNVLEPSDFKGITRAKCADFFGISESSVHKLTSLLKLIPELQDMADDENFPFTAFTGAVALSQEDQYKLYLNIQEYLNTSPEQDITKARIEHMIKTLKNISSREKNQLSNEHSISSPGTTNVEEEFNMQSAFLVQNVDNTISSHHLNNEASNYNKPENNSFTLNSSEKGDFEQEYFSPRKEYIAPTFKEHLNPASFTDSVFESVNEQLSNINIDNLIINDTMRVEELLDNIINISITVKNALNNKK